MNEQEFRVVQCPYCGETIEVLVDCSVGQQEYIEDCSVCCRPINFSIIIDESGLLHIYATHENE